jgi:hypothetical protein
MSTDVGGHPKGKRLPGHSPPPPPSKSKLKKTMDFVETISYNIYTFQRDTQCSCAD